MSTTTPLAISSVCTKRSHQEDEPECSPPPLRPVHNRMPTPFPSPTASPRPTASPYGSPEQQLEQELPVCHGSDPLSPTSPFSPPSRSFRTEDSQRIRELASKVEDIIYPLECELERERNLCDDLWEARDMYNVLPPILYRLVSHLAFRARLLEADRARLLEAWSEAEEGCSEAEEG